MERRHSMPRALPSVWRRTEHRSLERGRGGDGHGKRLQSVAVFVVGNGRKLGNGLGLVVEGVVAVVVSNVLGNERVMVQFTNFEIALVVARLHHHVVVANFGFEARVSGADGPRRRVRAFRPFPSDLLLSELVMMPKVLLIIRVVEHIGRGGQLGWWHGILST